MSFNRNFRQSLLLTFLSGVVAAPTFALEIITEEDIIQGIVVEDQLVRVVDNAIFLFDTSSSMNGEFMDTGDSKLEVAVREFSRRNNFFPEIGHTFAVYEYTPWNEVYAPQTYNREQVAEALANLPERGSGNTPLARAVRNAEEVVQSLTGSTAVFLFYDGDYSGPNPDPAIFRLVRENDVCLIMISSSDDEDLNSTLSRNVSNLNSCSRMIPLENYLERPEYMAGVLFDVRATERIVTLTESRVAGAAVEDIVFEFDRTELLPEDIAELDELSSFLSSNPDGYVVLAGYTDNVGVEEYNIHLSQQRTEMVAEYLVEDSGIDPSRIVLHWYGSSNPIASNDTEEGRAANRRVEVVIAGI